MGFQLEEGDSKVDGIPVYANYDGSDQARVLFTRISKLGVKQIPTAAHDANGYADNLDKHFIYS